MLEIVPNGDAKKAFGIVAIVYNLKYIYKNVFGCE